ncbi:LRR 8 domain containing protein, partial [Asbolus verrucosus]
MAVKNKIKNASRELIYALYELLVATRVNQKFERLTREFLREATKLHELTIRNCHLGTIDADAFDNQQELEILSFNFNKIRYFENGTFKSLQKLKILELHHNKFVDFNLEQFRGLVSLEILGLPSNFLRNIRNSRDLLEAFPNLKKMEVKKKDL